MRKYIELCEKKKKEENDRWIKKTQDARTEGQVWEVVRRERRRGGERV